MNKKQLKILEEYQKNLPKDEWILGGANKYINPERKLPSKRKEGNGLEN